MTPVTASNQFKFRQIQVTNPSDKSKRQIHVNNKIRAKFLFHVKLELSSKWIIHHYVDWPLVFLNEILISAIKFLERLLKPQGYIALWQKWINQALVAISEIIIVWAASCISNKSIFVCKLPPRSDISRVNQKVYEFNQLLLDKFSNSDFVFVIDTVPPERRLFSKDGIHLSDFGLVKVCGILLSNLYDRIAPNLKRKKHKTSKNIQSVKSHT